MPTSIAAHQREVAVVRYQHEPVMGQVLPDLLPSETVPTSSDVPLTSTAPLAGS